MSGALQFEEAEIEEFFAASFGDDNLWDRINQWDFGGLPASVAARLHTARNVHHAQLISRYGLFVAPSSVASSSSSSSRDQSEQLQPPQPSFQQQLGVYA